MKKYVIINGKKLYIANVVFVWRYEKRQREAVKRLQALEEN